MMKTTADSGSPARDSLPPAAEHQSILAVQVEQIAVHRAFNLISPTMQSLTRLGLRPVLRQSRQLRRQNAPARYSSSSTQYTTSTRNFRLTPTTAVLCFVPVHTGFLGVWQLQRLKWKVQLIEDVDTAMAKDPMILPNDIK